MTRLLQINNPTGLIQTKDNWLGEIPGPDQKFTAFKHPYYGLRAGMININNKVTKGGLNTLAKLIPVLSPPIENNVQRYLNHLFDTTGIRANDDLLNGWNAGRLASLALAITVMENGWDAVGPGTYYTLENVTGVAKDAINGTRLFEPKPRKSYAWLGWVALLFLTVGLIAIIYNYNTKQGGANA